MSAAKHTAARYCDVMAALDARRVAHQFRRQGQQVYADVAWRLVHGHLMRAAIAKVTGGAS
jgi:hypothetical protein